MQLIIQLERQSTASFPQPLPSAPAHSPSSCCPTEGRHSFILYCWPLVLPDFGIYINGMTSHVLGCVWSCLLNTVKFTRCEFIMLRVCGSFIPVTPWCPMVWIHNFSSIPLIIIVSFPVYPLHVLICGLWCTSVHVSVTCLGEELLCHRVDTAHCPKWLFISALSVSEWELQFPRIVTASAISAVHVAVPVVGRTFLNHRSFDHLPVPSF